MWALNHLVNPVVRALLRSPLHRVLSGRLVLLRVRGRRSGRLIELPVGYEAHDDAIVVHVGRPDAKRWWRNIGTRTPVELVLRGRTRAGVAERIEPGPGQVDVRIAL